MTETTVTVSENDLKNNHYVALEAWLSTAVRQLDNQRVTLSRRLAKRQDTLWSESGSEGMQILEQPAQQLLTDMQTYQQATGLRRLLYLTQRRSLAEKRTVLSYWQIAMTLAGRAMYELAQQAANHLPHFRADSASLNWLNQLFNHYGVAPCADDVIPSYCQVAQALYFVQEKATAAAVLNRHSDKIDIDDHTILGQSIEGRAGVREQVRRYRAMAWIVPTRLWQRLFSDIALKAKLLAIYDAYKTFLPSEYTLTDFPQGQTPKEAIKTQGRTSFRALNADQLPAELNKQVDQESASLRQRYYDILACRAWLPAENGNSLFREHRYQQARLRAWEKMQHDINAPIKMEYYQRATRTSARIQLIIAANGGAQARFMGDNTYRLTRLPTGDWQLVYFTSIAAAPTVLDLAQYPKLQTLLASLPETGWCTLPVKVRSQIASFIFSKHHEKEAANLFVFQENLPGDNVAQDTLLDQRADKSVDASSDTSAEALQDQLLADPAYSGRAMYIEALVLMEDYLRYIQRGVIYVTHTLVPEYTQESTAQWAREVEQHPAIKAMTMILEKKKSAIQLLCQAEQIEPMVEAGKITREAADLLYQLATEVNQRFDKWRGYFTPGVPYLNVSKTCNVVQFWISLLVNEQKGLLSKAEMQTLTKISQTLAVDPEDYTALLVQYRSAYHVACVDQRIAQMEQDQSTIREERLTLQQANLKLSQEISRSERTHASSQQKVSQLREEFLKLGEQVSRARQLILGPVSAADNKPVPASVSSSSDSASTVNSRNNKSTPATRTRKASTSSNRANSMSSSDNTTATPAVPATPITSAAATSVTAKVPPSPLSYSVIATTGKKQKQNQAHDHNTSENQGQPAQDLRVRLTPATATLFTGGQRWASSPQSKVAAKPTSQVLTRASVSFSGSTASSQFFLPMRSAHKRVILNIPNSTTRAGMGTTAPAIPAEPTATKRIAQTV